MDVRGAACSTMRLRVREQIVSSAQPPSSTSQALYVHCQVRLGADLLLVGTALAGPTLGVERLGDCQRRNRPERPLGDASLLFPLPSSLAGACPGLLDRYRAPGDPVTRGT